MVKSDEIPVGSGIVFPGLVDGLAFGSGVLSGGGPQIGKAEFRFNAVERGVAVLIHTHKADIAALVGKALEGSPFAVAADRFPVIAAELSGIFAQSGDSAHGTGTDHSTGTVFQGGGKDPQITENGDEERSFTADGLKEGVDNGIGTAFNMSQTVE